MQIRRIRRIRWGRQDGQSLLETAIAMPLLMMLAFNAINVGYIWFMVLALSAAPRHGVQFASQGGAAIQTTSTPSTTLIKNVVYDNLTNAIHGATTSNASVRVCAASKGIDSTTHKALCDTYGPSYSFPAIDEDPEAPLYVLQRVDVVYTLTPIIPGGAFNAVLPSNLQFHRQVSMRSLY